MTRNQDRIADALRRHERVTNVIRQALLNGGDVSVSAIARRADVDRSYLYRHRNLLELLHKGQTNPPAAATASISRASPQTDIANAHERNRRLQARNQVLEKRPSELMGEQAWKASGLARLSTSKHFNVLSLTSNNAAPSLPARSKNAIANSPPPAPPTGNHAPAQRTTALMFRKRPNAWVRDPL
jgi:transposase-like protein